MQVSMTAAALSALLSVLLGIFLGVLYDIVRFSRVLLGVSVASPFGKKGVRPYVSWVIASLGDLFFFVLAAICMCVFFFLTGDGRMRGYGLVGAFLGFEVYYHTIGRLFIGICGYIAGRVRAGIRWCFLRLLALVRKIVSCFLKTPIVMRLFAWYNDVKTQRKLRAEAKKRRRRMEKNGCVKNGF